jgi:hypothetical protein
MFQALVQRLRACEFSLGWQRRMQRMGSSRSNRTNKAVVMRSAAVVRTPNRGKRERKNKGRGKFNRLPEYLPSDTFFWILSLVYAICWNLPNFSIC